MSEMKKSEQLQFTERLDDLKKIVSNESLVQKNADLVQDDEWGGADLIITTDPNRNHWETDVFVVVKDIKPVLWMINELRELFDELGSGRSRHTYYPYLGESINKAVLGGEKRTAEILLVMIDAARKWANGDYEFTRKTLVV